MSRSHNPSPADRTHIGPGRAFRRCVAAAVAALALLSPHFATAAPPEVRTPVEVRTQPNQFIVVAVANPVTGRPAAVGGTAHGYGTSSNYRISASANNLIRELARIIGGGGGGRSDLAEAGGKDPSRLDEAVREGVAMVARSAGAQS